MLKVALVNKRQYQEHCKSLEITEKQGEQFRIVRNAFANLIRTYTLNKNKRIEINIAYQFICCKIFKTEYSIKQNRLIQAILKGDKKELIKIFQQDKQLINFRIKGANYPTLYLAVRSGHYEIVKLILQMGCHTDFGNDESTPMHCAAYYGHYQIISLLLEYGISLKKKNFSDNLPVDQAATQQIKKLLINADKDLIQSLTQNLMEKKILISIINLEINSETVVKKLILKNYLKKFKNFEDAFHGTKFENLESIAQFGLKKPGDVVNGKTIQVVRGHIAEGRQVDNVSDWGRAVFISPSIFYASNECYSKDIIINGKEVWLPVVQVKVNAKSYTSHQSTTPSHQALKDQPTLIQYRVGYQDQQSQLDSTISTSSQEINKKVVVVSLMFLKKKFMEDNKVNYNKVMELIAKSEVQNKFEENIKLSKCFTQMMEI